MCFGTRPTTPPGASVSLINRYNKTPLTELAELTRDVHQSGELCCCCYEIHYGFQHRNRNRKLYCYCTVNNEIRMLECLELYKINRNLRAIIQNSMGMWKTTLEAKGRRRDRSHRYQDKEAPHHARRVSPQVQHPETVQ